MTICGIDTDLPRTVNRPNRAYSTSKADPRFDTCKSARLFALYSLARAAFGAFGLSYTLDSIKLYIIIIPYSTESYSLCEM